MSEIKILKQLAMSAQGFKGKVVHRIKMRNECRSQKFEIIEDSITIESDIIDSYSIVQFNSTISQIRQCLHLNV